MNEENRNRIAASHVETLPAPPDRVLTLACPVAELDWVDGWQFEMIYSDSGVVEEGCIFVERMSSLFLFGEPGATTWVVTLRDKDDHRFHCLLMFGDQLVGKFEFERRGPDASPSTFEWSLTLTALNDAGDSVVAELDREKLRHMLTFLGRSLRHYCETGEQLPAREALATHVRATETGG